MLGAIKALLAIAIFVLFTWAFGLAVLVSFETIIQYMK